MSSLTKSPKPQSFTISASDGTLLSYYRLGSGPGVIIIPGAMSSALSQLEVGTSLAADFTVFLFSRRSRGLSGPYPESITNNKYPLSATSSRGPTKLFPVYDPAFSAKVLEVD